MQVNEQTTSEQSHEQFFDKFARAVQSQMLQAHLHTQKPENFAAQTFFSDSHLYVNQVETISKRDCCFHDEKFMHYG